MNTGTGIFIEVEEILKEICKKDKSYIYEVKKTHIKINHSSTKKSIMEIYGRETGETRIYINKRDYSPEYQLFKNKLADIVGEERTKEEKKNLGFSFYVSQNELRNVLELLFTVR